MIKHLDIEAPAKVNLTLDVLRKRPDGYHDLETVMQLITLRDRVSLEVGGEGLRVSCSNPALPDNDENLAFRAARLLYNKYSLTAGLKIDIEKNIPVGAGLAGGSADAAAVLLGLNILFDLNISQAELLQMGLELGSDVPFCMQGETALARGRGEILEILPPGPRLEMVLVKPDYQLSTAEVYRDLAVDEVIDRPDTQAFVEAWAECDMIGITSAMKNVLETVSLAKCPEIAVIKKKLNDLGALTTLMSGSGPSVIGVFRNQSEASQAWEIIKDQYSESYLVSSYDRGDKYAGETSAPCKP